MTTTEQNAVTTREMKPIDAVRAVFERMKPQFAAALPKHLTPDRMVRVALTAIQNTPKLLECDKTSLYSAVMRAAQLGLEPDGVLGQAYLIPFAGKVQFIVGYKGLIDLARRSGEVSNMIAKEVCEKDDFEITWHEEVPFRHKQPKGGDRGEVIGFWALARFKDGGFHWDYLTVDEVLAIRDQSSGWKQSLKYAKRDKDGKITEINSPWFNHFNEMAKKTAIRRIAKFLPMSVQKAAMAEELVDAGKKFSQDEYGDIVLNADGGEIIDNEEGGQVKAASKLDQFAGTPHDAETGEVIDQKPKADALPVKEEPEPRKEEKPGPDDETPLPAAKKVAGAAVPQIPAKAIPGNATQTDWEGWVDQWNGTCFEAESKNWLIALRQKNKAMLDNMKRLAPAAFERAEAAYSKAMAMFEGGGMTYLFFDTETSGLPDMRSPAGTISQPRICQLGAIVTDRQGRIKAEANLIVKPDGWSIPQAASDIHGISQEDAMAYGLSIKGVLSIFDRLLGMSETVIAHNIRFDLFMLEIESHRSGVPLELPRQYECTMENTRDVLQIPPTPKMVACGMSAFKSPNLQEAFRHFFGRDFEGPHDAMADVRACKDVFFALADRKVAA